MMNMINHHNFSEKMQRTQEYIGALEEERRKIQVFQRELPLCLELVTQAIETCKQQLSGTAEHNFHGQSECSEQTSTEGPVLEEFIPLKRSSSSDDEEDEHQSHKTKRKDRMDVKNNDKASSKKSDWLRSVQLWNQTPDPTPKEDESPRKVQIVEVKSNENGGAFHPFKKEKEKEKEKCVGVVVVGSSSPAAATQPAMTSCRSSGPAAAASSTADTGGGDGICKKEEENKEKEGQSSSQRKARRCWSPELHKRFLMALQQLGGSHVATPKQIRELMKVDGLTNDEVKSHLQKYRLHNRRPSSSIHNSGNNNNPQAPQFVVVGGIWVPPPEYAAMAATTTTTTGSGEAANSNGIYTPIATLASPPPPHPRPLLQKQCNSDDRGSHSGGSGGGRGGSHNSPVTSSSTDTTTDMCS